MTDSRPWSRPYSPRYCSPASLARPYGASGAGGGAYSNAAFFVALGLYLSRPGPAGRRVAAAALPLTFVTMLFTNSRGALLMFAVGLFLVLVMMPREHRGSAFVTAVGAAIVAMPGALLMGRSLPAGEVRGIVVALLATAAAGVAGDGLFRVVRAMSAVRRRQVLLGAGGLLLAAVAVTLVWTGIPAALLARVASISLENRDVQARLLWALDGLKSVRDYPVLGVGGGGWDAIYHKYQSYGYFSTQVHNDFVQIWLEGGTLGVLALLGMFGSAAWLVLTRGRGATGPDSTAVSGML